MFDTLPPRGIHYPVADFRPLPQRAVVPTAEMAANLSRAISEVAKNLSPEERKRKETELAILSAHLRDANLGTEMQQIQLDQYKKQSGAGSSAINAFNDAASGSLSPSEQVRIPTPTWGANIPTTYVGTFHGDAESESSDTTGADLGSDTATDE